MLYRILPALVPLLLQHCAVRISAQTLSSTGGPPAATGAWTEVPSCKVQSDFSPYGAAVGVAGDSNVFSFQTLIYLDYPATNGPSVC